MSVVVFDFETGGISPDKPNIQLAAIALSDDWSELGTFERKILFNASACDPEALELNSYSPEDWTDAKPEHEVARDFCEWLRPYCSVRKVSKRGKPYSVARLCGHNAASFDFPRLQAACCDMFLPADFHVLDTLQAALWHCTASGNWPENLRLTTLCDHFGIDTSGAHDALADCRMTARLARHLMNTQASEVSP